MKKSLLAVVTLLLMGCTSEKVTIMSFNIRDAHKDDGTNSWQFRRDACVDMLNKLQPDVFGMQEVVDESDAYIAEHLPQYQHVVQGRTPGLLSDESCPLYWRTDKYDLVQSRTFWLSETPNVQSKGWDAKYERIATYILLRSKKTGHEMIVFNTHLDHKGATARQESLRQIADTLRALSGDTMALFVMGDMNVEPEDSALIPMYDYMHWSQAEAKKTTQEKTFTGFKHRPDKEKIIDFIFYRNAKAEKFEVIKDTTTVPFLSDHRPIQTLFTIK